MEEDQQFCLRWNNHQSTLISVFDTLLENGTLVDCTLAAEGKFLKAHKVVLSACSPYFATLLSQQYDKHPIFILKDVKFQELRAMMDYMYRGEVNISQDQLGALLKAAESLQIKGLSENRTNSNSTQKNDTKPQIPVSKSGLTIEQKRPFKHTTVDIDSDVACSREGSASPTSRKRKKVRRRSTEGCLLTDNHDHLSNSSCQSLPHIASTSGSINNLPTSVVNVTKKTELQQHIDIKATGIDEPEPEENEEDINDPGEIIPAPKNDNSDIVEDKTKDPELLLEPKNEYDESQEENVEDLTLEDEDMLEDLDHAGPSHSGEGSSQGYSQWQVERTQEETFVPTQESGTAQRDTQESLTCTPSVFQTYNNESTERFYCPICNKSYLRKRHLQRHMRDECIGIPPRFHCELCPSKFRRKYHLVRHLHSKHGIITPKTEKNIRNPETGILTNNLGSDTEQFQVNAFLMKKENYENFLPDIKQIEEISRVLVNLQSDKKNILHSPESLPFLNYMSQLKN